ncbi:MAG TPA: PIN domain-containing protein [Ktedonobacterales bacterium]|jgi:predicted nucleic acid-binding protein
MASSQPQPAAANGAGLPLRVLVDTNVALDWLLNRQPWSTAAQPLWDARDAGRLVAYLPASVLTDIFYIVRRQADISTAFAAVDRLFGAFGLLLVDDALLHQARALSGTDFEDNIQIACAVNARLDLIVTRDPTGFRASPVLAIEPPQITAHLKAP